MKHKIQVFLVAILTLPLHAMEKKFELKDIIVLAKQNPGYHSFIETYFREQLPKEPKALEVKNDELCCAIVKKASESKVDESVTACVLNHLRLAYYNKLLVYQKEHKGDTDLCVLRIRSLKHTLGIKN